MQIGDGSSIAGNGTTTPGIITLAIPGTFPGGFTVTKIGANAFSGISTITTVTIPIPTILTSVTTIGDNAFKGSTGITTFNLQNVTTIGANAFDGTSLTTITVPDTVTRIDASAFANTTALHTISVPKNNVIYGSSAFATNSPTMISVTVRGISVASDLASWKTANTSYFTTDGSNDAPVAFLAGVGGFMTETVGNITYVFSFNTDGGDAATNVRIGDGTTTTNNNGTTTLPSAFPSALTPPISFTGGLFTVTEIGTNAFNGLPITDLTIPDNILTIGTDAFTGIGNVGDATATPAIPPKPPRVIVQSSNTTAAHLSNYEFASSFSGADDGVENMPVVFSTTTGIMIETGSNSNYVFTVVDSTTTPQKVRIGTGDTTLTGKLNGLINAPASPGIISPPSNFRGEFYTVTIIGQQAFMGCKIGELTLHPGLAEIRDNAFRNIQGITTIKIPHNIAIANYAFWTMTPSTGVTILVEGTVGATAFVDWKSGNVTGKFKFSVSSGSLAYEEGASFIPSIIDNTNNIQITGSNNNFNLTGTREIPGLVVINGVTYTVVSIGDHAFMDSQIEELFLPTTLTSIGDNAFKNVTTLTTVTYRTKSNVETIGENAFEGTNITKVSVPISMRLIRAGAFYNIGTLTSLVFTPERIVTMTIGDTAFQSTAITSVIFPDTVTTIGEQAFADGVNLRQIEIGYDTSIHKDVNSNTSTFARMPNDAIVIVRGVNSETIDNSRVALGEWKTANANAFSIIDILNDSAHIQFVTKNGYIIPYVYENITYILGVIGTGSEHNVRIGNNTTIPGNGLAFPTLQYSSTISLPETCQINIAGNSETYSVTKIGTHAFSYTNILGVTIHENITHIGSSAFYNASLETLLFEEDTQSELLEIGTKAFMQALQGTSLIEINIPDNVESIKNNAFRRCFSIKQVTLSSNTIIGANAFSTLAPNLRVLVTHSPLLHVFNTWRTINEIKFSAKDASNVRFVPYNAGVTSSICFPAGTPVVTDQETVDIEKICTERHTIGENRIVAITQTVTEDECLVRFEPGSLEKDVPSIPTDMSCMHSILHKGDMIPAITLVNLDNVYKIPYTPGTLLFNVLLDTHSKMMINNMTAETLHPNNGVAKFTRALLEVHDEGDRAEMMYAYNVRAEELKVFTNMKHRL